MCYDILKIELNCRMISMGGTGFSATNLENDDSNNEVSLIQRLKNGDTLKFVNSKHRNEQLKNENWVKNDGNCSSQVEYYEDLSETASGRVVNREAVYQSNQAHGPMMVSDIEKNLLPLTAEGANDSLYEIWRLQEFISQCDSYLSYYSALREASLTQYYQYLEFYNGSNRRQSAYVPIVQNVSFDHESCDGNQNTYHGHQDTIKPTKSVSAFHQQKSCEYWEGVLPKRKKLAGEANQPVYSRKVFVGGVPWDITEEQLRTAFSKFGNFVVQFPTRDSASSSNVRIKGYLYLIFDNKESVRNLVEQIKEVGAESNGGSVTFNFRIKCNRNKHVQIVPWIISDNFWEERCFDLEERIWTIFVGGLHGKLYAQALFAIFNSLFKNVISVKIDTDEYNYPTGSGSIRFSSRKSYIDAINANYIEVKTSTFGPKSIEIQHYMEDEVCSMCLNSPGRKFCKTECFEYFCEMCWKRKHKATSQHVAVTRHHKNKENEFSF